MSKSVKDGLEPVDLFGSIADGVKVNPSSSLDKGTLPSTGDQFTFDPSNKYYEYIDNPTPYTTDVDKISADKQSAWTKWGRGLKIAGANAASSLGQSLASTFDLIGAYQNGKAVVGSGDSDFDSSLFGLKSSDMMAWSKGVEENNRIFEKNPGSFSPGDAGWWTNEMLPQVGTLVGTAVGALATTAAIEGVTGGEGTGVAAANLYNSISKAWGAAKTGEIIKGGLDLAKGMRGAAAMYATISRYSEATFEAQNNYKNTYDKLSQTTKPDGTPYSEEEKKHLASEGAKVDFGLTLAQLPLDILAMRAMIFNPLTGSAEGGLERGLEKVAGMFGTSKVGKAAGWATTHGIGAVVEGAEAGGIPIFQAEGEHHAMVLAGLDDDKSTWGQRVKEDMQGSEFSNMIASGVLGSLLIGPAMAGTKSLINNNRIQAFNQTYKDYTNRVAPILSSLATSITKADASGDTATATVARRRFNADKVLDGLHLDTQANKSNMFDAHLNFLQSTLDQANAGKSSNVDDLFGSTSPEQLQQVKTEFKQYIDDANRLKQIYNEVGQRYNRNITPIIANQHFQLENLLQAQSEIDKTISTERGNLSQYNLLSPQGKELHESEYQLNAINGENNRLNEHFSTAKLGGTDKLETDNITQLLDQNKKRLADAITRVADVNADPDYSSETKDADSDIINSSLKSKDYQEAINNREKVANLIALQRKKIALWNKPEYTNNILKRSINSAKTTDQLKNAAFKATPDAKVEPEITQAVQEKEAEINANAAADNIVQPGLGNANLFKDEESHINNIEEGVNGAPGLVVDKEGNLNRESVQPTVVQDNLKEGDKIQWNVFGNEGNEEWTVVKKTKTRGGKDAVVLSKQYIEDSKNGTTYSKEYADANGIKYVNAPHSIEHTVALDDLKESKPISSDDTASFEPNTYDLDKSPDEAKQKVKDGVGGLIAKLGDGASFEDLTRHVIRVKGEATADKIYNAIKYGWEANGKSSVDYNAVYDRIFGSPLDQLLAGASQLTSTDTQPVLDSVLASQQAPAGFDNNNQPIYKYVQPDGSRGIVTNEASAKMAFVSIASKLISNPVGENTIEVSHQYTDEELNQGDYIDSTPLLDPKRFGPGTEIDIKIPANYNSIKIPIYKSDGTKGATMTFGQWVAETKIEGLPKNLQEIKKYTINLGNKELEQAPIISSDSIDWDKSNIELDGINIKRVKLLEVRGKNRDNQLVGTVWVQNEDGLSTTFDVFFKDTRNISPDSQEYKDKIPMINYRKGSPSSEKGLSFVHDIGWYHPLRFNQEHPDDMQNAIDNTRAIREEVLSSNNKSAEGVITGKRQTTFNGLKVKETIPLREANPQTHLAIVNEDLHSVRDQKMGIAFPTDENRLMNTDPFQYKGQIVEIRRYGTNADGKATHMAFPVTRSKLSDEAQMSIVQAITIYASRKNLTDVQKKVVEHIKDTMGTNVDITANPSGGVSMGLKLYLSHFINVYDPARSKTNKEIEEQAKKDLAMGTPYISFIDGGNIVYGQAGVPMYTNNTTKATILAQLTKDGTMSTQEANQAASEQAKVYSLFINPNLPKPSPQSLQYLNAPISTINKKGETEKTTRLGWYEQNLDLHAKALDDVKPTPIVHIDKNFTSSVVSPSYNDYLLDNLKSDIKSINIGTEKEPNYVTNIQPVVTYDTKARLNKIEAIPTNEEIKDEVIKDTEVKDTTNNGTQKSVDDIIKEEMDKARANLGNDLGRNVKPNYEPRELLEDEQIQIAESIDRIAGLTNAQQGAITNFLFNQITGLVNFDTKVVTKTNIDAQVEKVFDDIVEPMHTFSTNEAARLTDLMEKYPSMKETGIPDAIQGYKDKVQIINNIKDDFDQLKKVAYEKVKKNTGIKENKQQLEREEGEQDQADETVDRTTDFYTDVLTESPENKLSYSMRRFFGQTRQYDKEGNALNGFLNLPVYEDPSAVLRTLMTTLVDIPADFNSMLDKLKEKQDGTPWMKDIIQRLENTTEQKKAQFVTVMHNTSLRMKFSMIGYDRLKKAWSVKIQDATLNGIAATVKQAWNNNLLKDSDFHLILGNEDGLLLNKKKAETLINRFEGWTGVNLALLSSPIDSILPAIDQVRTTKPITVDLHNSPLSTELRSKAVKIGDRMRIQSKGQNYQIKNLGNDKYQIAFMERASATDSELTDWLREFGITISPNTMKALRANGLYHNGDTRPFSSLFETGTKSNGLFGILYEHLRSLMNTEGEFDFNEYGNNPLDNTVVTSLANEEAKHIDGQAIFGFRINGKGYFALTAPSFISDRARDLKTTDSAMRDQLKQISFSSNSLWLNLLQDENFRDRFSVVDDSAESLKQTGKKSYRDANLASLSDADHEITKVSKFQVMTQGEVRYGPKGLNLYPDTGIPLRMSTVYGLTMSDKDRMKLITTAVLNLSNTHLKDGVHPEVLKALYNETVKPELLRMIKHAQNGNKTNISGYDKGASLFLMMPEMNNVEYSPGLKLIDAIKNRPLDFNAKFIEGNGDIMKDIYKVLKDTVDQLTQDKLGAWEKNEYITRDKDGNIDEIKFFDKKYMSKFSGTKDEQLKMAAMDYEINALIANANNFMIFAGDPALYYKSKATDRVQQAKDTFVNVNKRLANQVAPGTSIPNSQDEKYLQIFLNDRLGTASNIDYLEKLLGKEGAKGYREIKTSDAQEYTTWKEHLNILNKLGKSADYMFDITPEDIESVRKLMDSGISREKLDEKQLQTILKVMQPIKPVYTGQLYDKTQDVMRTMYIKSSSFPLIPQLTAGLEIDKLRQRMEALEKNTQQSVRASYQSANKVGALADAASLWDKDGNIDAGVLKDIAKYTLPMDRKNFRIQQEVPFKSDKTKVDMLTMGTQLMKLLFGDEMMNQEGFEFDGEKKTGKELHQIYTDKFTNLIKEKQAQLFDELGLDERGEPIDRKASMQKLQSLLEGEALKRGYPLQDVKGLKIDRITGDFSMPLWASSNSNRYESMLNAIVAKRMVAMKFPGAAFVTGSEEGFRTKSNNSEKAKILKEFEDEKARLDDLKTRNDITNYATRLQEATFKRDQKLEEIGKTKIKTVGEATKAEKSGIVYTSHWNGTELQPNQVFMPSKFRDNEGNLIDLLQKEGSSYKYITSDASGFKLKDNMFDKQLLQNLTFRIPTSGHQSGNLVSIAGFLPHTNGDLVIVSKNSVVQKGLDFDVDKENAYQLWTRVAKNGKLEVLSEKHRTDLLAEIDKMKDSDSEAANTFFDNLFGEDKPYTQEEINGSGKLKKANSKFNEKLLQNDIIKINHSVYNNQSDAIQAKINKTLNTDYAEKQAALVEGLINQSKPAKVWTPLSSEHQKQTMISGASGKIGTGAYSLDVVFHSLAQQANLSGKPIEFNESKDVDGEKTLINRAWRFGDTESTGILGGTNTLDGGRPISEVVSERQNIAVDNATLQVMGKVNINDLTMDVDKVFVLLGIDKGSDGNSIPFLFLSQPIVRDYVDKMKNANSIMAEFDADKEDKIIANLLSQYDTKTNPEDIDEGYWDLMSAQMTNANLMTALSSSTPDGKLQGAVLRRFLEMKKYGMALRSVQTSINFRNNSFGKSFFDVIEKKNNINKLANPAPVKLDGKVIGNISGQTALIGDYIEKGEYDETPAGYIDMGANYIRPTTVMGAFNVHAASTAYNLWNKYFPYDTPATQAVFDEIMPIVGNMETMGIARSVELKQDIFKDIKKYLSASNMNGIIQNTDNVNAERARLYIDSDTNTSLAKYIKKLMQINDNPAINDFIKTNKLFNRFEFDTDKQGKPSLIKYNNAAGEEFDEQYLYESLSSLLEPNGKTGNIQLPTIGNKSYTLATLAQDLIAYCYLGNAIQEAIQFTKYTPVAYLNIVGYSNWLKNNTDTLGIKPGSGAEGMKHLVSEYTMQYIQHNPGAVKYKSITADNYATKIIEQDSNKLENIQSFKLRTDEKPIFITIYNPNIPKGDIKSQLYWFDGEKYTRIPVLGTFGMDEYQPEAGIGTSIINGKIKNTTTPQKAATTSQENPLDPFDVNSGKLDNILQKIQDAQIAGMSELAKALSPYVGATKIAYKDNVGGRGQYIPSDNQIYIDTEETKSERIAQTILHETIHSLTYNQIRPYTTQNLDGSVDVGSNAPGHVTDLVRLYNDVRSKVDTKELQNVLKKVQDSVKISSEEYNTKYGLTNLDEFMSMALTSPGFQKYLASSQFKQSGQTLLERFKEIISKVLTALGVQFDSNSAAAHAINSIFGFIDETAKLDISDVYKKMADEAMNDEFIPPMDDEINSGPVEGSFEPFPEKDLNIKDENCI